MKWIWKIIGWLKAFVTREDCVKRVELSEVEKRITEQFNSNFDRVIEANQGTMAMLASQINVVSKNMTHGMAHLDTTMTSHHQNLYSIVQAQDAKINDIKVDVAIVKERTEKK